MRALSLLLLISVSSVVQAQPPSSPPEMLEDAQLSDVFFIGPDRGWAVGDRGVIWHSDDGGERWRRQVSPVSCRLEAVCFIDEQNGWIVGGHAHPYTHKSTGVILRTRDGGRQWTSLPVALPALTSVKFFDAKRGWAVGHASSLYGAGVFQTEDGGRSWASLPSSSQQSWLAADFLPDARGVIVGRDATVSSLVKSQLRPSRLMTTQAAPRHVRDVCLKPNGQAWLVGDGGLLLTSSDAGATWQGVPGTLPEAVQQCDLHAIAVQDEHCWIVGAPGSFVLHTPDGGHHWELLHTGHTVPLQDVTFIDRDRGWAVGDLGCILVTRDGGQRWWAQRSGGKRAALLGLYSEPARVPWELFVRLSGDEGYLGALEIISRRDIEIAPTSETTLDHRTAEAIASVGGSSAHTAWRFPLRQAGLMLDSQKIVEGWNMANDAQGLEQLEAHLVRLIRQWRPEVVITEQVSPNGRHPLAHLMNQTVLAAVQQAADDRAHADQIGQLGLTAWEVKKVLGTLDSAQQGTITLTTDQLATRLGRSLAEQAAVARGLISATDLLPPQTIAFQLLIDRLPQQVARADFFSGIAIQPGADARRKLSTAAGTDLQTLSRNAQRRRNAQQLVLHSTSGQGTEAAWLAQIGDLTRGVDAFSAGQLLYQLGVRYRELGQLELAAETFQMLIKQHESHALSEPALLWLIHYQVSSEVAWHLRRQHEVQSYFGTADMPVQEHAIFAEGDRETQEAKLAVRAEQQTAAADPHQAQRITQALALSKIVQRTRPALYAEPAVRLPLAIVERQQDQSRDVQRTYQQLLASAMSDSWKTCAQAELWLLGSAGVPGKTVYECPRSSEKPRLDGVLNDTIWTSGTPLALHSAQHDDAQWPASALIAWDEQFLYLAASCQKAADASYQAATAQGRPRDPDLTGRDRVEWLIDLDRDYTSWFRLTLDHRGWVHDSCLQDPSWNPRWFVAATEDDAGWTVEAAIPWSELTPETPTSRRAYAIGIQRIVPGVGMQSWTQPATVAGRGDGLGLMVLTD